MPRSYPPDIYTCRLPAPHPESCHCASMGTTVSGTENMAFWMDEDPRIAAYSTLLERVVAWLDEPYYREFNGELEDAIRAAVADRRNA